MTKAGKEGMRPQLTQENYQKQLTDGILHFKYALNNYQGTHDQKEMVHYQSDMDEQMQLIQSAIREIKRSGIQKEGKTIQNDYQLYRDNPSSKNLEVLQHDLSTLQEYNYLP